jgi:hypothetical protein
MLIGGVIATWFGWGETAGIDWLKHGIQVVLAVLAIWGVAQLMGRRSSRGRTRTSNY